MNETDMRGNRTVKNEVLSLLLPIPILLSDRQRTMPVRRETREDLFGSATRSNQCQANVDRALHAIPLQVS